MTQGRSRIKQTIRTHNVYPFSKEKHTEQPSVAAIAVDNFGRQHKFQWWGTKQYKTASREQLAEDQTKQFVLPPLPLSTHHRNTSKSYYLVDQQTTSRRCQTGQQAAAESCDAKQGTSCSPGRRAAMLDRAASCSHSRDKQM